MINLKSDTTTKPTPEMIDAMFDARIGDDAYKEDETTNELEKFAANLFGKPAAIFTSSGTMSNQLAVHAHTRPGDEVILDTYHHINYFESAQTAAFCGVALHPLITKDGIPTPELIAEAWQRKGYGSLLAKTSLVCVENTMSHFGGKILPISQLANLRSFLSERNLKIHMDGARLSHAVASTGISFKEYAQYADTVSLCFSKGLGAPFGSILVGDAETIQQAKKYRKWHGGQLHQGGYMAAAALYAIKNNVSRLEEDHLHAREFTAALNAECADVLKIEPPETNIVMIDIKKTGFTALHLAEKLKGDGVALFPWGEHLIRAVFHLNVSGEETVQAAEKIIAAIRPSQTNVRPLTAYKI